jgi:HEAT repeat protein
MSASLAVSDAVLRVAWITAQVSLAGTALLLLCLFWMHARRRALERRERAFVARWRPTLAGIALDDSPPPPEALPSLARREHGLFLREWIAMHEALDRTSCRGFEVLSRQLRIGEIATRMLRRRRLPNRLLGTVALGYVGDAGAWEALLTETGSPNLGLSLAAARALVRLDPARAVAALMPVIERREDWPHTRVGPLLHEAGPQSVTGPLLAAIAYSAPRTQARLARLLPLADESEAAACVRRLLQTTDSDWVVGACIGVIESPTELPAIRRFATHPRWHIRMLSAKALGRLGETQDEARLVAMLADTEWWVRYRAAQALVALPWMSGERVQAVRDAQADQYARDAMDHAIAERAYR